MKTRYIDIDEYWGVLFCYDFDFRDCDEIAAIMDSFDVGEREIRKAINILMGTNSGMAISRNDISMSVIFVSEATSIEQFLDTCAHEIDHVQSSILDYYDVEQGGERGAWLQGYLMRKITEILCEDGYI